ncbi:hypothetical protein HHI36_009810 [Cryptolaemus montrouzieri]|uniref:Endonuclease/exonuclease/phosphatase domain-containing protein n=1 Tax=Cryptolaemus montrouzieri TaxID=559131 RepID=A0ABD2MGW7_9CUCU
MNTQNNSLMKKLEKQKEEILDLKRDFHRLETQQQQMKEEIAHLKETSLQKNLKNNAVISEIDAKNMNDTQIKGVVIAYGQKLNVQLSSENFEAYKIGKNIERLKVCFKEFSIKNIIMKTKNNVQIKAEDIGLTGNNYIFINQDLTPYIQELYKKVRDFKKKKTIKSFYGKLKLEHNYPEFLILTETWRKQEETKYFSIYGYCDVLKCRTSRGRGVAIYIKKDIEYKEINIEDSEDCNIAAIKIKKLEYKIIAIYRAPQINPEDFFDNLDEILGRYKNAIIIGDINLNILDVNKITNYKEIIELNNYHIKT